MVGWLGLGTGLTFAGAAVLLGVFYATSDERYDRAAEWFFVVFTAFAVVLALVADHRLAGATDLSRPLTVVGIVGVAAIGVLELLSALGRIDFQRYGWLGALGFGAWMAWIGGVSLIALTSGTLPAALGWVGVATVVAGVVIVGRLATDRALLMGQRTPTVAHIAPMLAVFAAIVVWLIWLGFSL